MSDALDGRNPTYMQEYIDIKQYEQLMRKRSYTESLKSIILDRYAGSILLSNLFEKVFDTKQEMPWVPFRYQRGYRSFWIY